MKKLTLCIASAMLAVTAAGAKESAYSHLYKGLPFEMPVIDRPGFPANTAVLTDYGAVADGKTLCSQAFAKAIEALSAKGGGTLEVPAGVWLTGPIEFRSNINMHLDGGALILFTDDKSQYPLVPVDYEGYQCYRCASPIWGIDLENIAITGNGVIDGNGDAWRYVRRGKMNADQWRHLLERGGVDAKDEDTWYPSEQFKAGAKQRAGLGDHSPLTLEEATAIKDFLRPTMVKFVRCRNVLFEGVLFQNSPAWNLYPLMCENVILDGVYLKNPDYGQNTDAMDIESCRNVIIYRTTCDVGDDGICIKSGKDAEGRSRGIPTENVIVRDCRVFAAHGGFVIGSEMSGGVRNIAVSDCQFIGTDIGLRFKSARGRGGLVENIWCDNINMLGIGAEAVLFDLYYWNKNAPDAPKVADETTPLFRNFHISRISSFDSKVAIKFNGIPEQHVQDVTLSNSVFTSRQGSLMTYATGITLDNVTVEAAKGPALKIGDVKDITLKGCTFTSGDGKKGIAYTQGDAGVKIVK